MDQYSAVATQPISGYIGQCRLCITKTAIIVSQSNGEELATWLYNCIRQFNAVDCCFSFTSGRRGPFGVGEYCFELPQKKVVDIQKKISGHTGAVFAHNKNYSGSTLTASTNISNPSQPKFPAANDRHRSDSETAPSATLSTNLYPLTNPPKLETYQNTAIKCAVAPPLPARDPGRTVTLQNDAPNAKYVNAMKGVPKPLPRTMKPSLKKTGIAPTHSTHNSTSAPCLPYTSGSATLPSHSGRSDVIAISKPTVNPVATVNPVGGLSDHDKDPLEYGDMVCSSHGPDTNHKLFSPPTAITSGYADVDYDVIRRNREMGKFTDSPGGPYSNAKNMETYNVPSSLKVAEDTYDVPRPTGEKFEYIADVYEDERKQPSPNDLYSVPTSNQPIIPDLYNVPPARGQTDLQMYNVPSKQGKIYDNPSKSKVALDHGNRDSLYDTPQSNQPVVGEHETYDVVPSRKAYSSSPQPEVAKGKRLGYENIGPHGEILGEIVADQLRQDLLSSLNSGDSRWTLRSLKDVSSKFSRSCDFLSGIGQEPTKRFSSNNSYKGLIIPNQENAQRRTLPPSSWHTYKSHRRLSGSHGDIPAAEDVSDDTYVVLNKTEKPNGKPPLPTMPRPTTNVAASVINGVEDNGELNDMYIAMHRSPSHSTSDSTAVNTETLPKGYINLSTAKEALEVKKSISSIEIGRKETSPTNNEGRRQSDLVWPGNSGWSNWVAQDEQASRKLSDNSEVFSPPPTAAAAATDEHPIVVSKPSARAKRSILLKGVSPQPISAGQEKRLGSSSPEEKMATLSESPDENTAPTVNADGSPRPTYINRPHNDEQAESVNDRYNIEKLKANRLKSHAYDEIDGTSFKQRSIKRQSTTNSQQGMYSMDIT